MSHFAHITETAYPNLFLVGNVIVSEQDFIDSLPVPSDWIKTSYNTFAGVHKLGGTPLRKNYAGIGYIYDKARDAFYQTPPFQSWVLNETTCQWEAPIAYPASGDWKWDEETVNWVPVV